MRVDDALLGGILLAFAAAVVAMAQGFPVLAGMDVGPGLFPTVVGTGLGLCGLVLIVQGLARRRAGRAGPWVEAAPWMRSWRLGGNLAAVIAALVLYVLMSPVLGFHLTAVVLLLGLFLMLSVRWPLAVGFAVAVPLLIHYVFYTLLRVPLPWGVLTPVAW